MKNRYIIYLVLGILCGIIGIVLLVFKNNFRLSWSLIGAMIIFNGLTQLSKSRKKEEKVTFFGEFFIVAGVILAVLPSIK